MAWVAGLIVKLLNADITLGAKVVFDHQEKVAVEVLQDTRCELVSLGHSASCSSMKECPPLGFC